EPRLRPALSEEGHEADPAKAAKHVKRLLERGNPAAVCTHGPVLPGIMEVLTAHLDLTGADAVEMLERFVEARDVKLEKGEVLVCHVAGTGSGDARKGSKDGNG